MNTILLNPQSLKERLETENIRLIDVSVKSVVGKKPIVYDTPCVIPNSSYLDIFTALCDLNRKGVHNFPTQTQVAKALNDLTIQSDAVLVLYDNQGIYSAPRAWWVLKSYGVEKVHILDGGLPAWMEKGYPTTQLHQQSSGVATTKKTLQLKFQPDCVVSKEQVLANLKHKEFIVIDVRSAARFHGIELEFRPGVRSGHIPSSLNLPFAHLLAGHQFKSKKELQAIFSKLIGSEEKRLVFSCGSGVTACIGIAAASIAGYSNVSLYDGSWTEWGSDHSLPIE